MDKVVEKLVALGVPGLVLLVVIGSSGLALAAGCSGRDRTSVPDAGDPLVCTSDVECFDGVDCTTDTCSSGRLCQHVITPALCAAGEACNPITGCQPGQSCASSEDCLNTDGDACTIEHCDLAARVCSFTLLDGDGDGDPPRACGGHSR